MGCESMVYASNDNTQTIADGSVVSFGSINRKFGCHCGMEGGNATVRGKGVYYIDANVTFVASAGTAVITLYQDGTAIPGADAAVITGNNGTYTLSIPTAIRQYCDCHSVITAVIRGITGTVSNAAIRVVKGA